ncbi:hypothetical protein J2Y48_004808 [Mycoplana sp. BE70]|nr:hypothetical protein [Mycoplana sp. BE70]
MRAVLIGSVAFSCYSGLLGIRLSNASLRKLSDVTLKIGEHVVKGEVYAPD